MARSDRRLASERSTYVALLKAASSLEREFVELLKTRHLTPTQYNVLRILRGSGPEGATCGAIGSGLIKHDPDVTRLADRLERAGLIERTRDATDRRVVRTRITAAGLAVLADLDEPVDSLHGRQLSHMSESQLEALRGLLAEMRPSG